MMKVITFLLVLRCLPRETDTISSDISTLSLRVVHSMADTVSPVAIDDNYTGTTSSAGCSIRCVEKETCQSFFINKQLQQCRLNHRLLHPNMTTTSPGWRYYVFVSDRSEGTSTTPPASSPTPSPTTTLSLEPCTRGSYCCRLGLCMKLFEGQKRWGDASQTCQDLGERLLIIDSEWKQDLVVQMVVEMGGDADIDIGGHRINSQWKWQSGQEVTDFYWAPRHPYADRDYLTLEYADGFLWGNTDGTRFHDYACEKY